MILFLVWSLLTELVLNIVFYIISQKIYKIGFDKNSIVKGLIERVFLVMAFVNNLPTALVVFGALKLGTRLKHKSNSDKDEDEFNNFFLIGNFLSMSAAIIYFIVWRKYIGV